MTERASLGLFEGFGVEIEYMIVNAATLDVAPVTDRVLKEITGTYESDAELGEIAWSNELVLHVIELKTNGPAKALAPLPALFQQNVDHINRLLKPMGARLMPAAMHPWMDPLKETLLWPHEYSPVYESYDRIFTCKGHGWANLQSAHLNLPFHGDDQFGRLHAAIRLILPILPAIAASSPIFGGEATGHLDNRLDVYRTNQKRVPSVAGRVIPEPVFTKADYHSTILERTWADIAPHDPDGILRYEWLNSRGAIARFMRDTIEVRVLDNQECPAADVAIHALIVAVAKAFIAERWHSYRHQRGWSIDSLEPILLDCIRDGERAVIGNRDYLELFGVQGHSEMVAVDLWRRLVDILIPATSPHRAPLDHILRHGTLARRILKAVDGDVSRPRLASVYGELCDCLAQGRLFGG